MSGFECSHCTKIFQSRKGIVRHLRKCGRKGSDIKRLYACSHCPREFFSVSGLMKHEHKKHGVDKRVVTKSLKCLYCSVKFASPRGRNAHAKKVHPEYVEKLNELNSKKVFSCLSCSKSFTRKTYRKQHEKMCMAKFDNLRLSSNSTCNYEEAVVIPPAILQTSTSKNFSENIDASLNVTYSINNSESSATPSLAQPTNEVESSRNEITTTPSSHVSDVLSSRQDGGDITPKLQRYLENRKSFLKLNTPDVDTPRKSRLNLRYGQELIVKCKKRINSLKQRVRRLESQVETYKDLILHLENANVISETAAETFLNELPSDLLAIAFRKRVGKKTIYDKELRKFALTLDFYSKKGYQFVRESFDNLLPAESTLRNWYSQLKGEPGFCAEALEGLKAHVKASGNSNKKVICNLVFDEMEIRKELIFRGGKYHGYVDMGFGESCDNDAQPLAKKALVFMLVCLNGSWKLPLAYFLVDSINGNGLSKLLTTALQLIDDCGAIVRSITFDGLGTNLTACKILGANLRIGPDFKPWFPHPSHPEQPVYVFLDPCHALKLVRNTFADYTLENSMGRKITFHDVKALHELQQEEELMSAPKLTKRHVNYRENKMKVRLAAQVLSSSVSAALIHAAEKGYRDFQTCAGTAEFCKQFDKMFDMMNSRSLFSRKLKPHNEPIKPSNKANFVTWCQEAEQYITSLKINNTPILQHDRKTGFLGFITCLRNIIPLFNSLHSYGLSYLLSYKLLQDHLENWFSAVRSKGGYNNNPNAEQFKAIFKRLLVHHELRASQSANCMDDAEIKILNIKSIKSSKSNNVYLQHGEDILDQLVIDEFIDDSSAQTNLSKYQEDVVAYIAGFILKKLEDKKLAHVKNLAPLKDSTNESALIRLKNRGRLVIPSTMMVEVCKEIEKKVQLYEKELLNDRKIHTVMNTIVCDLEEDGITDLIDDRLAAVIVEVYVKMRIKYICRKISEIDKSIRHKNTKAILFSNQ